jgi:hypothetical protein
VEPRHGFCDVCDQAYPDSKRQPICGMGRPAHEDTMDDPRNWFTAQGAIPQAPYNASLLNRSAFEITDTELNVMAALATSGLSNNPKKG